MPEDTKGGEPAGANTPDSLVVKVGEESRTMSAEDVGNLLSREGELTQKSQQIAPIMDAANRFGMDPETFTTQSVGALSLVGELIEAGVIDEQGNRLDTAPLTPAPVIPDPALPAGADGDLLKAVLDKTETIVQNALAPMTEQMGRLEKENTNLLRLQVQGKLMADVPGIEEEDVGQIFGLAASDRTKGIMEHAKAFVDEKSAKEAAMRKKVAGELGVDLEEWEANQLMEQGSDGPAGRYKGKSFRFKRTRRAGTDGENEADPLTAMTKHMGAALK